LGAIAKGAAEQNGGSGAYKRFVCVPCGVL
jgi:hypothetical protein